MNDELDLTEIRSSAEAGFVFRPITVLALLSRLEQAERNADTYQKLYEQRSESLEQAEVACMAERAAAEADRVALEQEALKLLLAFQAIDDPDNRGCEWRQYGSETKDKWLAVARAARELNKEDGQ